MRFWIIAALFSVTACGPGGADNDLPALFVPEGCNPLAADWHCGLPYPSDVFLLDDPDMPTGKRLELQGHAQLVDVRDSEPFNVFGMGAADGFSPLGPILVLFPQGVQAGDLVFHLDDMKRTLSGDSPTVLLNADTGERVLHFAELDPRAETDERRALIIRPLVRLGDRQRYVVGLHGLRDLVGDPITAPEGFRRLRDKQAEADPALAPLVDHFEEGVFQPLHAAGIKREALQLAWDFTTASFERSARDMLDMRSDTMDCLQAGAPEIWIDQLVDEPSGILARRLEGRVAVPLFLDAPEPGARLVRDGQGRVVSVGVAQVPFSMAIPRSVVEREAGDPRAGVLQYGHGFFGLRDQIFDRWMVEFADQHGYVLLATDWWGFSQPDVLPLMEALLNRPDTMTEFSDRVQQGMINALVMAEAAAGPLAERPELDFGVGSCIDTGRIHFWGISLGHILGGTYISLSPRIERSVLSVGGAGISTMMFRARPFGPFLELMEMVTPDPLELQRWAAAVQSSVDRIDPGFWAPLFLNDPLFPQGRERRVLMEMGLVDTQVPNLATRLHARSIGAALLQPSPEQVPGLDPQEGPWAGSALVEHDFGLDPETVSLAMPPAEQNRVHGAAPELDVVLDQMAEFLKTGLVVNTCDGVCDPD